MAGNTMQTELEAALRLKSNEVMRKKRATHAAVIEKERQKKRRAAGSAAAAATAGGGAAGAEEGRRKRQRSVAEEGSEKEGGGDEEQGGDDEGEEGEELGDKLGSSGGEDEADRQQRQQQQKGAGKRASSAEARAAAAKVMALGDGVLSEGRYRDSGFFLGHSRCGAGEGGAGFSLRGSDAWAAPAPAAAGRLHLARNGPDDLRGRPPTCRRLLLAALAYPPSPPLRPRPAPALQGAKLWRCRRREPWAG
jgi:hypothetical protein